MKRYVSHSDISFNILIEGKRKNIRFESITAGGSHYFCKDNKICGLIEKNEGFNKLFFLDKKYTTKNSTPAAPKAPVVTLAPETIPEAPVAPVVTETVQEEPAAPVVPEVDPEIPVAPIVPETMPEQPTVTETVEEEPVVPLSPEITPETPIAPDIKEYPEVTTFSEAKDVLVSLGALSSAIRSKETVAKAAEELKVYFPNLK